MIRADERRNDTELIHLRERLEWAEATIERQQKIGDGLVDALRRKDWATVAGFALQWAALSEGDSTGPLDPCPKCGHLKDTPQHQLGCSEGDR